MPGLAEARKVANELFVLLSPHCERLTIAGSLRREKPEVKDIELVAQPRQSVQTGKEVNELLVWTDELVASKVIEKDPEHDRWGKKYRRFLFGGMKVDLFMVTPPAQWGVIELLRTGSWEFNVRMFGLLRKAGYRVQDGHVIDMATEQVIDTYTEHDVFRLAGIEWVHPRDRN